MPDLSIEFDHPTRIYSGGDLIGGNVVISHIVGKPAEFAQFVGIKLIGKAWTKWKETKKGRNHLRQYLVTIADEEIYFEKSLVLFPPNTREGSRIMDPMNVKEISSGRTQFPFLFNLPDNVPSSFDNKHGTISYMIELLYKRLGKPDREHQLAIQVNGHYDLNLSPNSLQPGNFLMEKKLFWWMGLIQVIFKIPKRAFLRGEELDFELEVKNRSVCNLTKISVHLTQIATFTAKGCSRSEPAKVTKVRCSPVSSREEKIIKGKLKIPDGIPPTSMNPNQIVQLQYSLTIKVKASVFGQITQDALLEGRVPITIGTVGCTVRTCQQSLDIAPVSVPFKLSPARSMRRVVFQKDSDLNNRRDLYYEKPPDYDEVTSVSDEEASPGSSTNKNQNFFSIA